MSTLRVIGGTPLRGTVAISGRKNAALKLIAASILSDQPVTITRLPDISDVAVMLKILEAMGATVERHGEAVTINAAGVSNPVIPHDLGRRLRASLVFVGPLLARFGRATFPHPGGCVIGKRSIGPHLLAFEQLGAHIEFNGTTYELTSDKLEGTLIYLREASVTGTENLIMAAVRAHGRTEIMNAAQEDHIVNLCDLLRGMGFTIHGDGTSTVVVDGDPDLQTQAATVETLFDEIEVGTFAVAALVTGGEITITGTGTRKQLMPILSKLDDFKAEYRFDEASRTMTVLPSPNLTAATVQNQPWPAFPADLSSPFTVLATQAHGTSLIHDTMYEGRLYFVDLLQKMGATVTICDPHRALVTGPSKLYRSSSISPDLRAGAALVLAALTAEGESVIEHAELIDRGYVKLDDRLRELGAQITREE